MNGRAYSMGESDFYAARSCGYAFSYFTIIRRRCCTPFQAEGTLRSNACEPERRFLTTRLASVRVLVEVELSSRQTRFFPHTFVQFSFGRSASIKAGINNERSVFSDRNSDARQTFCRLSPYEFFERTLVSTMCPPYIHRTIRVEKGVSFSRRKKREQLIPLCSKSNAVVKPLLNLFTGRTKEGPSRYRKMLAGRFPREGRERRRRREKKRNDGRR